jgi:hypothetical protein
MARVKKGGAALNLDQFFGASPAANDLDFLLGAAPEETAERAQARGLPLLDLPVDTIAPDPQQVRRLPLPEDLLRMEAANDRAAAALLGGLRELGQSMIEHGQVQPAIVYIDSDPNRPTVTHRLLHGQRRWSAAVLTGVPTLWVVEVPRPTDVLRLLRQFEENERREGLSDMERSWSLVMLKEALQQEAGGEVPWSVVEEQLQISTARRHDLLRLMRFAPDGQALIMRYGWPEWVLRPLHMAVNAGTIEQTIATDILRELANANEVTSSIVAAVVDTYHQQQIDTATSGGDASQSTNDVARSSATVAARRTDVVRTIVRMRKALAQIQREAPLGIDPATRAALAQEVEALLQELHMLADDLKATS